jgi:uncharacterized protein (TIGR02466 family)
MSAPDSELFELFPTPVRCISRLLSAPLVQRLIQEFADQARQTNAQSSQLMHTQLVSPEAHASMQQVCEAVLPHVVEFGELLLGERLAWFIKEMWINALEPLGHQALHNHANSFVSGVVYLTSCHPSSNTVFVKPLRGADFVFDNTNARSTLGPYNADKWVAPDPEPGDLTLFPSYVLHEVPINHGTRRMSLAFNAVPERLDSWGYTLKFAR